MNIAELAKFRGGVGVDTISELTSASGVTIDSVLLKDNAITATGISVATITEYASGSGVTVDGILLKDNVITGDATGVKLKGGDGTAIPAGMVGESALSGTTVRSGTNGDTYSVRSSTVPNVSGSVLTSMIAITLNKGNYLVSGHVNGYSNAGVNFVTNLQVGATAVVANRLVTLAANAATDSFFCIPIRITADNTVVAIYGAVTSGTAGTWGNELFATRIG
jgi:hypothetical protein